MVVSLKHVIRWGIFIGVAAGFVAMVIVPKSWLVVDLIVIAALLMLDAKVDDMRSRGGR